MALVDDGFRNSHSFELRKWREIKKGFTHFSDGDIGIAKITPCFQNRKSVIFQNLKNGSGAGTTELSIVRVINDSLSRNFLLWFFKSAYFIENGIKSFTGTAGQQRIHKDYLSTCLFPLPPLAEQKRIVAKIEELLPYIDRYEQAWSRLEAFNKRFPSDMQKSLLQMAIQGKLVEQRPEEGTAEELYQQIQAEKRRLVKEGKIKKGKPLPEIAENEVPFEIPESWKWVRLGEITYFQGGYAYKSTSYVPESSNQIIRLGNVKQGYLFPEAKPAYIPDKIATETECYRIQLDDILVTMTGTRRKKDYFYVTKICEDDLLNRNLFLNQRVGCFRVIDDLLPEYLLKVMQNEIIREVIFKKETGTANQGNLGSEDMKMYVYVPLPPLAEQKRIVAKLEELLTLCERLK